MPDAPVRVRCAAVGTGVSGKGMEYAGLAGKMWKFKQLQETVFDACRRRGYLCTPLELQEENHAGHRPLCPVTDGKAACG